MKTDEITNSADVIDSRDVIERIDELESWLEDRKEEIIAYRPDTGAYSSDEDLTDSELDALEEEDEYRELCALRALAEEAGGCSDWVYGATLINEDYFTEYVIEMLKDIGELPSEIPWYIVIDEEATAENVKADYTSVEFDGKTFYVRY